MTEILVHIPPEYAPALAMLFVWVPIIISLAIWINILKKRQQMKRRTSDTLT